MRAAAALVLIDQRSFSNISDAKSHGSVDALVLKLAASYLSGTELTLFKELVASMNNSANSGAVKIFDTSSKSVGKCNFQLGVVK
jgi:S-adenosylmethionine:diacylglycerol 3-amino-3-carboxypropyl transferase